MSAPVSPPDTLGAARGARRERAVVLLLGAGGAVLALLAASRPWLDVRLADALAGSGRLHPSGRAVAPLVPAAALVALAGSVAAVTLRRVGRYVSGLLLVVAAGAIGAAAVGVLARPLAGAAEPMRKATGRTGAVGATAATGAWPWVAVLAASLVLLAGAVTVVRGRGWSGLSDRYDAPAVAPLGGSAVDPAAGSRADSAASTDPWDALTRGEDPTA